MNYIRFSHDSYTKFELSSNVVEDGDIVELVGVSKCNAHILPESFKVWDSEYGCADGEMEHYPLPAGEVLVLIFWNGLDDLFPTIRRCSPQKEKYYLSKIGEEFTVRILGREE